MKKLFIFIFGAVFLTACGKGEDRYMPLRFSGDGYDIERISKHELLYTNSDTCYVVEINKDENGYNW